MENNIKAPTLCHCCGVGKYKEFTDIIRSYCRDESDPNHHVFKSLIEHPFADRTVLLGGENIITSIGKMKDVYKCENVSCRHVLRNYFGNASDYHSSDYRKKDGSLSAQLNKEKENIRIGRNRRIVNAVHEFLSKSYSCLEIGVGRGYFIPEIKRVVGKLSAIEIDKDAIEYSRGRLEGVDVRCLDVLEMPEDKGYDVVFALDVLEHIEDVKKFVTKMSKIVNKYLILQLPMHRPLLSPNPNWELGDAGHIHYFTGDSVKKLFKDKFMFRKLYYTQPGETAGGHEFIVVFENKGE